MKTVAKYNLFKAISTLCTLGAPIVTLLCCSDMFIHRSETAISAAGAFSILICILFLKDKIAENLKMPSAFIVSMVSLILILIIENIMVPIKTICIVTMITSGVDEITFKKWYKVIETTLPENVSAYKTAGFIFTTTKKLNEGVDNESTRTEGDRK